MIKIAKIISIAILLFACMSCISAPEQGALFTYTTQHVYGLSPGGQVTSAKIEKRGQDCSYGILILNYFYYGGGASIRRAMDEAGITKIGVVDRSSISILGYLFYRECVVVFGE